MKLRSSLRASLCLLALGVFTLPSLQAQLTQGETAQQLQLNTITTAVPFLMIAPDSRSGSLGDAGVALSPDGAAMAWNPARMAFTDQTFEAHLGYAPWLRALVDDMSLAYLSGTRKLNKRQAIGMALRYFSLGNITFTDVNGCSAISTQNLIVDPSPFATAATTNASCSGYTDGSATLNPSTSNISSYAWSDGQTTQTANNLTAGIYNYTVTDINGCNFSDSIIIY